MKLGRSDRAMCRGTGPIGLGVALLLAVWALPSFGVDALASDASAAERAAETPEGKRWRFEIDPAASSVTFELGAVLHSVEGTAELMSGSVRFDPATGAASGHIGVDATSLETGNTKRDEVMHRKVLESATFPEIYFEPRRMSGPFDPDAGGEVRFEGTFGIHGEEHPVELTFDVSVDRDIVSATTELRVPYVEWGMEDPSKFLLRVEKHVTVRIDAVGMLSAIEAERGEEDDVSGDR